MYIALSVFFAGGLFLSSFLGVLYIVVHNKAFQCVTDNNAFILHAELVIYAASAVCLYILTVLGAVVKMLRTKKENTDGN